MRNNRDADVLRRIIGYCNEISETIKRFGDDYSTFAPADIIPASNYADKLSSIPWLTNMDFERDVLPFLLPPAGTEICLSGISHDMFNHIIDIRI